MDQPHDGRPLRRHVSEVHGQTRIGTLREHYGFAFAEGIAGSARLKDVLHKLDLPSLSRLYRDLDAGTLDSKLGNDDRDKP